MGVLVGAIPWPCSHDHWSTQPLGESGHRGPCLRSQRAAAGADQRRLGGFQEMDRGLDSRLVRQPGLHIGSKALRRWHSHRQKVGWDSEVDRPGRGREGQLGSRQDVCGDRLRISRGHRALHHRREHSRLIAAFVQHAVGARPARLTGNVSRQYQHR